MASALAMAVSSTSPLLPTAAMSASSTYCANCCHSACDGCAIPRGRRRGQEPDRPTSEVPPLAEPPSSYRRHRKLSGPRRRVVYPYHNRTRYSSAAPYRKHRRAVRADNADSPPSTPDRPVSRSCRHCRRGHRSWFPLRERRDLPFDRSSPSLRSMPSLRRRPSTDSSNFNSPSACSAGNVYSISKGTSVTSGTTMPPTFKTTFSILPTVATPVPAIVGFSARLTEAPSSGLLDAADDLLLLIGRRRRPFVVRLRRRITVAASDSTSRPKQHEQIFFHSDFLILYRTAHRRTSHCPDNAPRLCIITR